MMNDLISVIVPVYNVEKYLNKCVYSILNQSYRDLEIILVDDGSTDSSGRICDELSKLDPRILVVHKNNGGLSDARNAGMKIANGNYISFIDSDDYVDEKFIEILYTNAKEIDADISISNFEKFYEGDDPKFESSYTNTVKLTMTMQQGLEALFDDEFKYQFTTAWGKIFRKSIIDGFEFPVGRNYEDSATAHILISKANRIVYINRKQYYYLIRQSSITGCDKFLKDDVIVAMRDRAEWFSKYCCAELARKAQVQYVQTMMGVYSRLTNSAEAKKKKVELYNAVKAYVKANQGIKRFSGKVFIQIELFLAVPALYSVIIKNNLNDYKV